MDKKHNITVYVFIDEQKRVAASYTTARPPSLAGESVCLKLNVEIPDKYFKTPVFEAKVKVPEPKEGILESWINGNDIKLEIDILELSELKKLEEELPF